MAADPDPVNHVSARVQAVVASATPTDLAQFDHGSGLVNVVSFMGQLRPIGGTTTQETVEAKAYRAASPINYVSHQSAPLLLIHGDADETIPFHQAELMVDAAQKTGAEVKLIRVVGGGHVFARDLSRHPEWPDVFSKTVRWLDVTSI